jgi:hypothetical protein
MTSNHHKVIPEEYRKEISTALEHYPELADVHIVFKFKNYLTVPYGTIPSYYELLLRNKRVYNIMLRARASGSTEQALFKNLPTRARIGVIGHELGHVLQFQKRTRWQVMKLSLKYLSARVRQSIERGADLTAIDHDLGNELYEHAVYIRAIPGYTEQRKSINRDYLKPEEITEILSRPQMPRG